MSRLQWFKHYNTAAIGSSFDRLRSNRDFETMACYWMILELLSRHEDPENRGSMEIPHRLIYQTWNVNSQRADKIVSKIVLNFANTISIVKLEQTYKVLVHNWLELQETRGGKRTAKDKQKDGRSEKLEVRSKKYNTLVKSDEASEGKFTPNDLVSLWNDKADPLLARVIRLTDKRKRQAQTALRDYPEADFWNDVINLVNASNFLKGLGPVSGDRSKAWRCDFDFIIRSDNALKIIEGKYS